MNVSDIEIRNLNNKVIEKCVNRSVMITNNTELGLLPTDIQLIQLDYFIFIKDTLNAMKINKDSYTDEEFYQLKTIFDKAQQLSKLQTILNISAQYG